MSDYRNTGLCRSDRKEPDMNALVVVNRVRMTVATAEGVYILDPEGVYILDPDRYRRPSPYPIVIGPEGGDWHDGETWRAGHGDWHQRRRIF